MLQISVSDTACNRLPSSTYNIRPTYSPVRLGVKDAIVLPVKVALKAVHKLRGCRLRRASCHLRASSPQFTSMSNVTSNINPLALLLNTFFNCDKEVSQ